jgi:adenylate cyclase
MQATLVFADLIGSTGAFESQGNALATRMVTQFTTALAESVRQFDGRVVKILGDGVLAMFSDSPSAVRGVVDMQRKHQARMSDIPPALRLPIRIGVAQGAVEMVGDDCYGDAVNVASRLSDLCGPDQIWATLAVLEGSEELPDLQFKKLGLVHIRGRAEPCEVCQIDWGEDLATSPMTRQENLPSGRYAPLGTTKHQLIELSWRGDAQIFSSDEFPIDIGRTQQADFVIKQPGVSRAHARLTWHNGSVVYTDVSSFGSWIRFVGGSADVLLRRDTCVLHGSGQIALGSPFADPVAAVITFRVSSA